MHFYAKWTIGNFTSLMPNQCNSENSLLQQVTNGVCELVQKESCENNEYFAKSLFPSTF
jgi:hypothetical protein